MFLFSVSSIEHSYMFQLRFFFLKITGGINGLVMALKTTFNRNKQTNKQKIKNISLLLVSFSQRIYFTFCKVNTLKLRNSIYFPGTFARVIKKP